MNYNDFSEVIPYPPYYGTHHSEHIQDIVFPCISIRPGYSLRIR